MMPYQSYPLYQAERTKTAAEIRRADEQLGRMAQSMSWMWHHATRPLGLLWGPYRRPQSPALLDPAAGRKPRPSAAPRETQETRETQMCRA